MIVFANSLLLLWEPLVIINVILKLFQQPFNGLNFMEKQEILFGRYVTIKLIKEIFIDSIRVINPGDINYSITELYLLY